MKAKAACAALAAIILVPEMSYADGYSGLLPKREQVQSRAPDTVPSRAVVSPEPRISGCEAFDQPSKPLSEESVRDCMEVNNPAISYTYQRLLRNNPTLKGKMVIQLQIEADGVVAQKSKAPENEVPDELFNPIAERVGNIRFPRSSGVWNSKYTLNFYAD